jgi:phage terminase large subunit GpA-like protein
MLVGDLPARVNVTAAWLDGTEEALRPPARMRLSQWADRYFRLSAESAAEPGRWRSLPYQRGVLDAITDPAVERVTWKKSARVGATKCMNAAVAYFMVADPCPIQVVQPTVEDAQGYSKEEIAPMLRDVRVLDGLVRDVKSKDQTVLLKVFPGGVLAMVGANSGRGFRRVSRRVMILDEVDGYPASAGSEGDPVSLAIKRTEYYWNRKIIAASTPLVAGESRIDELYLQGDQRRYYVPCPHCAHMDFLRFRQRDGDDEEQRGHRMKWDDGRPDTARFVCSGCGSDIEESHKRRMIELGEWRADAPFRGHASFHIWAAYSMSPNATWSQLVAEFLEAKRRPETLRTFVNTALGETWQQQGEAPAWEVLYRRREPYPIGSVVDGTIALTSGVDVQKDRLMYEVVAWDAEKRSSSVEIGCIMGDTADTASPASPWLQLDLLLGRSFAGESGVQFTILMMAVDSGYNTNVVYNYCRTKPPNRVIAVKGVPDARVLVGLPSKVDITISGRKMKRGFQMYPVGVGVAKTELYGWLGLVVVGGVAPPGYCRWPEYEEEYFRQLTAEHLVTVINRKNRRATMEWRVLPNRENHYLDCRVYARAAVALLGIDRLAAAAAQRPPAAASSRTPAPAPGQSLTGERKRSVWDRGRARGVGRGLFGRRR